MFHKQEEGHFLYFSQSLISALKIFRDSLTNLFDIAKSFFVEFFHISEWEKKLSVFFFTIININKENKAEYFCQMGIGYLHVLSNDTFLTVKVNIDLFLHHFFLSI